MKKRLIDYDKLYHAIMDAELSSTDEDMILNLMDSSVVDAVPVIRCRECKFWEPYGGKGTRNAEGPLEWEGGCMKWRGRHLESDFCSYGKEKKRPTNSAPLGQEGRWMKTV